MFTFFRDLGMKHGNFCDDTLFVFTFVKTALVSVEEGTSPSFGCPGKTIPLV